MSVHLGICCDSCRKMNFSNRRYKCLICDDFDLCATCHDTRAHLSTRTHTSRHPLQLIVPADDYERIYFGQKRTVRSPISLTCSLCGQNGFSRDDLVKHAVEQHSMANHSVLCPICFTRQSHLAAHLAHHTQENIAIKHLIVEERGSRPLVASNESSLLAKLMHKPATTKSDDQRNQFTYALLTDLLRREILDMPSKTRESVPMDL